MPALEYKKSDSIPLGGILVRKNGKTYHAVPAVQKRLCTGCAFINKPDLFCESIHCCGIERTDGVDVIFIRRKDLENIL